MGEIRHSSDYRDHRASEFPVTGEALDAIRKGFRALMEQGITLPPETVVWLDACDAVKARFVKPQP